MTNCSGDPPKWDLYDIRENPENELFESLVEEFTLISGWPVYYYIFDKENGNMDPIYGEARNGAHYLSPVQTRLVYEPTEESVTLDIYGISSDETVEYMMIPKRVFHSDVGNRTPMVDDVIKTLWNNRNYEIVDIGSEQKIFQGRKNIWEFVCKPFRYSAGDETAEQIATEDPEGAEELGNTDIDQDNLEEYGTNEAIEEESDKIYKHEDHEKVDKNIYGY